MKEISVLQCVLLFDNSVTSNKIQKYVYTYMYLTWMAGAGEIHRSINGQICITSHQLSQALKPSLLPRLVKVHFRRPPKSP